MKFTLSEALILVVPAAFLSIWATGFFSVKHVVWKKFTLSDLQVAQENETPAVVLCRPRMFWGQDWGRIDEETLLDTTSTPFVAYRHDYVYWDFQTTYAERSPEDKWVLDNGGYKEPLLILVSGGGELRAKKGIMFVSPSDTSEIVDFLELARGHRRDPSIYPFGISLLAAITFIVYRRRNTPIGG